MSGNLRPAHKYASVTATVLKWFTNIGAAEQVTVRYVSCFVSVAEATDTLTFSDEDGANTFLVVPLDATGLFNFMPPDDAVCLPLGKDIKVVHSGTSGIVKTTICIGKRG